jgi:hypothetical protein
VPPGYTFHGIRDENGALVDAGGTYLRHEEFLVWRPRESSDA